ncbi:ribitol-5-phosphate xylosyltransferase 1-like [Lineus longissimus]|uniref:ribitol-5-phosphate xylosyltransferase 1-like n=1 Tax=Lineus longissimus TaxID=88925 RepID=UPI00315C576F
MALKRFWVRFRCTAFRAVILLFLAGYMLVTCYSSYFLIRRKYGDNDKSIKVVEKHNSYIEDDNEEWNPWGQELENNQNAIPFEKAMLKWKAPKIKLHDVEIWGKAALGNYLWEHILNSTLKDQMGGIWRYGETQYRNFKFRFRTGPGVIQSNVPWNVENLVLALNGRTKDKITYAKSWLDYLPNYKHLRHVAVVLLGDEKCNNDWFMPYLVKNGGRVDVAFIIYDIPEADNDNIYQWPLGVATYRDFPNFQPHQINYKATRPYICNYVATVYKNTSREVLMNMMTKNQLHHKCYIKPRLKWAAGETDETRNSYIKGLIESDLTLNPAGDNTECYRMYEAMSVGSMPVIEDIMTKGRCGNSSVSHDAPVHLLKEFGAPVIFIKDWTELYDIFKTEGLFSSKGKIERRHKILEWYDLFKRKMRGRFLDALEQKFLR